MPLQTLHPQEEYGLRIGSHEGDKGIILWMPQTDEAICVVINGGITLNERTITSDEGEFDIEEIEIANIDGSCCLATSDDKILFTFNKIDGTQIEDFLGMNRIVSESGFMEIDGEPHIAKTTYKNTSPSAHSVKVAKLVLRPGVVYNKENPKRFTYDNILHFPVGNCLLEKRDGVIYMMGESEASRFVLFTVGTVNAVDIDH